MSNQFPDPTDNVNFSVHFPLVVGDGADVGFSPISSKDIMSLVIFNIKNVLFTMKGERQFDGSFGVGLQQYIFEPFEDESIMEEIKTEITNQLNQYVPYIFLNDIQMDPAPENLLLRIRIFFTVAQINLSEVLDITFVQTGEFSAQALNLGGVEDLPSDIYQQLKDYQK